MRIKWIFGLMAMCAMIMLCGCNSSSSSSDDNGNNEGTADLAISVRIDDITGFLNMVDGTTETSVTNAKGVEIVPGAGIYAYNGYVYTTGSKDNDKIARYEVQEDNSLLKIAETNVYENGGSIPTCFIFVDETKAYVLLAGVGQMVTVDPMSLAVTKRIDLSAYALDASGQTGGSDTNPEPSGGVIRDGKLYLGLGQIDSFSTWFSPGKASVLIIDVATDEILKHITDDRTCCTGEISPNNGLILDENGDIYVNNTASFGYYSGMSAGFLRIKNGEDEFDPDYYFSISDLQGLDVPGGIASYSYNDAYLSNGKLYTTLFIPALTSNPPDYVNDKNYQPYVLDLYNQTATKLNTPPTIGWSTYCIKYNSGIIMGLTTENGTGLYRAGETTPFITTSGNPFFIANY